MVLEHPLSKRLSLYGMNGGTCRVLPKEAQKTHGLSESCHGVKIAIYLVKEKEPTGNDDQRSTHVMICLPTPNAACTSNMQAICVKSLIENIETYCSEISCPQFDW